MRSIGNPGGRWRCRWWLRRRKTDVLDGAVGRLVEKDDLQQIAAGLPMVVETGRGVGDYVWSEEAFRAAIISSGI